MGPAIGEFSTFEPLVELIVNQFGFDPDPSVFLTDKLVNGRFSILNLTATSQLGFVVVAPQVHETGEAVIVAHPVEHEGGGCLSPIAVALIAPQP